MKRLGLALAATLIAVPSYIYADSKATVSGSNFKVIEIKPEANTGLNNIFVVYDTKGCYLRFEGNGYSARVYRFSNLGGGYAEEITDADRDAGSVSVALTSGDLGFIYEEGDTRYYCWVTNYANHHFNINSVSPSDEPDCSYSVLNIDGETGPITYYTINGQPRTLSRDIVVSYRTQEFDEAIPGFVNVDAEKVYESLGAVVSVSPPALCSTYFTVTGDRFLKEWNQSVSVESGYVEAYAVDCSTEAIQEDMAQEEASNVIKGDSNGLGGSAPAEISFRAYTSDAVLHYEWQMSREQDFENPDYRFYQQDLDYTFMEEGTFYLRFIGSNADGTCEAYCATYTVSIGASALECPNAFSPNDDGVNDIWKVSYRSLTDFHCEIFNRNGQRICGFDNPSDGWDGTWNGKKVKSGVYYYVITATGADGKKYKKSGDINIINSSFYGRPGSSTPEDF